MKKVRNFREAPFVPDWVQRYYRWKSRGWLVAIYYIGASTLFTLGLAAAHWNAGRGSGWCLAGMTMWLFGGMLLRTRAQVRHRQARQWVVDAAKDVLNLFCYYRLEDLKMETAERALALIAHAVHLMPREAPNALTRWFWDGKALLDLLFPDSDDRPYEIAVLRKIYPLERLKAMRDTVPPALLDLVLALERAREAAPKAA